MIQINETILNACISKFDNEIIDLNNSLLTKVKNFKKNHNAKFSPEQKQYINRLIAYIGHYNFIKLNKKEISDLKTRIKKVPSGIINYKKKDVEFKEIIKLIFSYKQLRDEFLPKFFYEVNIRACVYCNANFTTTIEKNGNQYESRFQFDHILPISKHPHFSITITNLVPSCFKCNHNKSDRRIKFDLYTGNAPNNEYSFSLKKSSVIKFFGSFEKNDLSIIFNDPYVTSHPLNSIENNFHISKIYNEHKDIAEEIIIKSYIYNNNYLKDLKEFYEKKIPNSKIPFDRLLFGNYLSDNELLLRPMAKFTSDINKEINLLKNDINKVMK